MKMFIFLSVFTFVLIFLSSLVLSNTGWWQFGNKNPDLRLLLSPSSFSPSSGEKFKMIFSFVNKTTLLSNVTFYIEILKLGQPIFTSERIFAESGISHYSYTFEKGGFYEIRINFSVNDFNDYVDFPISVIEKEKISPQTELPFLITGFLIGFAFVLLVKKVKI